MGRLILTRAAMAYYGSMKIAGGDGTEEEFVAGREAAALGHIPGYDEETCAGSLSESELPAE